VEKHIIFLVAMSERSQKMKVMHKVFCAIVLISLISFVANLSNAEGPKININTAGPKQLETLPGIGPKKAKAIIEHRKNQGKFKDPAGIMKVKGIGEEVFKKIKGSIKVHD
jgi:competence protein ComEA